ncbi:hypothetical protein QBC33DRAFT_454508 [Phialemonium atrogriseum]|uniref:Uncharacterized protein n=1 Tax=Phialemonium atrogriseum TaxID=1093897 RepID=A0AAJ0BWC4_9PEZI|nr:uncharacterized protein QBC33DRAFT_454508 [Phialemonium atrogriseum]KAK1765684.1 hypothetical protein QBC33DRAFT_454508 [Phialemonium atrogriseum]
MSSSTSLGRTRSFRKPGNNESKDNDADLTRDNLRTASPSRLPVKGLSSSRVAPGGANTTGAGNGSNPTGISAKSRPTSGILGRSASVRQPQSNAAASSTTTSRPPITSRSRPIARPTSSSGSAPTTLSRPTTSSGVPSSATTRKAGAGHARTKSSVTALTGATILRPPSQTSAMGERARDPPGSSSAHQRQSSSNKISASSTAAARRHARAPSESVAATTFRQAPSSSSSSVTSQPAPTQQPQQQPQPQQQQQQQQHPRLRPAFTTLQQHYSPAKSLAPKALTATFLAPPSPSKLPANVAASAETARLQTELLQLHLVHRAAPAADAAWRDSARARLGERFRAAARGGAEVARLEAGAVERLNVRALRAWAGAGGGGGGARLEERVQMLDAVLSSVWGLGEPGGRYARMARRFEKWVEGVAEVVAARRNGDGGGGGSVLLLPPSGEGLVFVSDLDAGWKAECAGLVRKLDEWARLLAELGDVPRGDDGDDGDHGAGGPGPGGRRTASSLERILGACRSLVRDMLAELELMQQIERDAIEQENEWIRSMTRDEGVTQDVPSVGAIWRVI